MKRTELAKRLLKLAIAIKPPPHFKALKKLAPFLSAQMPHSPTGGDWFDETHQLENMGKVSHALKEALDQVNEAITEYDSTTKKLHSFLKKNDPKGVDLDLEDKDPSAFSKAQKAFEKEYSKFKNNPELKKFDDQMWSISKRINKTLNRLQDFLAETPIQG